MSKQEITPKSSTKNLCVDAKIHQITRVAAAKQGISVKELVEKILERELKAA